MIRNSVKRGREQGQEIIDTKQTALGIKPLQLASLLHISRILFFSSLLDQERAYLQRERVSDSHHILGWLIGSSVDAGSQQLTAKLEFSLSFSFLRSNLWYLCSLL